MIINIPTPADYYTSGKELLNFAWDTTAKLLVEFDQAGFYGFDEAEISDPYWAAAKRTLTTALTIVQQAVELIIKGRIVEISPYILISDPPSQWPSPYKEGGIDFEAFRTVDAQDLIRVHDTFAQAPFGTHFVQKFHSLRRVRNVVMHSAGKNVSVQVAEVIDNALYMHKSLFPEESWFQVRREFLRRDPGSHLGSGEYATNTTCWEAEIVVRLLEPSQVTAYLGIDKKQRKYLCPACLDDANTDAEHFERKLAVLAPKAPGSTNLYCPVCNHTHTVVREDCAEVNCEGNVISGDNRCLTCSSWQ